MINNCGDKKGAEMASAEAVVAETKNFFLKYTLKEILAGGNYSTVYLCENKHSKEIFAAKVMHSSMLDADSKFESELKILENVQHPNIIKMHDCYLDKGQNSIIVMEFIRGKSLGYLLEENKLFPSEMNAKYVMRGLMSALNYLHNKRIVHGDIHPGNIIISVQGSVLNVKLIDFECAAIGSRFQPKRGLIYCLAPEIHGDNYYEHRVDVFSAGIIMIHCLSVLPQKLTTILSKEGNWQLIPISKDASNLFQAMLCLNPAQRITAQNALKSPWFRG